jgi:Polyketide cyclase / dehydrase and lipid transport
MKAYQVTTSLLINAPAKQLYDIIADYHNGHPLILPKPYFVSLEVEEGGFGAGTIINFKMRVFGKTQTFRAAITEPDPGCVLVESDLDGGVVTTFKVLSVDGQHSEVVITTDGKTRGDGVVGLLERYLTEKYLRRIYKKELRQLADIAKRKNVATRA